MKGILRPNAVVLAENAVLPGKNLILPAPNQFTHQLTRSQPYYFNEPQRATRPDGEFPTGTKVVLLVYSGGNYCRVAGGGGLYVAVRDDSPKKILQNCHDG